MLKVGDTAPAWNAQDQDGKNIASTDFSGHWFLLYFYPEDDTPGCTIEACGFRDNFPKLNERIAIIGVSSDTVESHKRFEQKYKLPFLLAADPQKTIISAYGADGVTLPERTTYLIDPSGIIRSIFHGFKAEDHAGQIEEELDRLGVEKE